MSDVAVADTSSATASPLDQAIADRDFTRYSEIENAREAGKPIPEAPAASSSAAAEKPAETAAVPEPASQEPKKGTAEHRIKQLLARIKELETPAPAPRETAKEPERKIDAKVDEKKPERPNRPKLEGFQGTYAEYEAAMEQYEDDLTSFRVAADRAEREQESRESEVKAANAKIVDAWKEKVAKATEDHPDFAEAIAKNVKINKTTDGFILKDPLGAKILYALCGDEAEAARIAALDPFETMEALVEIKRGLSPQKQAPEKKTATAPKPPTDLSGRNTDSADEAEAALKAKDFTRYTRIMNARDAKK